MKAKQPSAMEAGREWAKATRQGRRECETCRWARDTEKGQPFLWFVAGAVEARKARETDASMESLAQECVRRFGYPLTHNGLRRHVERCLGTRWTSLSIRR